MNSLEVKNKLEDHWKHGRVNPLTLNRVSIGWRGKFEVVKGTRVSFKRGRKKK